MMQPGPRPPTTPVVVVASAPISVRLRTLPMSAEFAPGLRYVLSPGENHFHLPPGVYRVRLYSQYTFWEVGGAELDIDTTRGPVSFFYAAPRNTYSRGRAGFRPQPRSGVDPVMILIPAALAVLLLLGLIMLAWQQL